MVIYCPSQFQLIDKKTSLWILLPSYQFKSKTYDSILVIINKLIKIIYDKLVKVTINTASLAEVIIKVVVQHPSFSNLLITD